MVMTYSRPEKAFACVRLTVLGPVAIRWGSFDNKPMVTRILLTNPDKKTGKSPESPFSSLPRSSCKEIEDLLNQIEAFTNGDDIKFSPDILRLRDCSEFQQKVLRSESAIPRGKVSSYGLISAHLGVPGGARAVGTALATNPFPLVIPCHRAIRSDGSLGGFQGGIIMKMRLLELEGITFDRQNRVVNPDFHYR
jgi:methylated-DNA-[protein]-cysteine S-methyltransferase